MCIEGREIDVKYSNWTWGLYNEPVASASYNCVVVTLYNGWVPFNCDTPQKYVCQSENGAISISYIVT